MPILFKQLIHKLNIFLNFILYDVSELQRSLIICSSFEHIIFTEVDTAHPVLINLDVKKVQDATSYRPGKNRFSKKENTKYTGPADNIYTF